ncbi:MULTISPECIES: hypothetical protein [unclassified Marinomonas]|uniref:hypothetical protein n=1 Tax=unclassified Marinomonas TaxID=196814 RepID=UPI0009ED3ABD|nr:MULTISPECIES: hypothetical protein [unclassified Marinomonas]
MPDTQINAGMDDEMLAILNEFVVQLDQKNAIEEEKALVKKRKAAVMAKINQQGKLTQGFRLVKNDSLKPKLAALRQKVETFDYKNDANKQQDQVILDIMTKKGSLSNYLDASTRAKMESGNIDNAARHQIANTQLKRKQLFLMFEEIATAQMELIEYSKEIQSVVGVENATLKQPPGAYGGLKDFHGALDKVTNRKRKYDMGDLKDAARMTIIFKDLDDMVEAKNLIFNTNEFQVIKSKQSVMKDRYGTSKNEEYNCGATAAGYKDIKFFLQMSNGHIAELQLNTENMMKAKKKGHIIYDILRDGGNLDKPFTIVNQEVIKKVLKNMNEAWFTFITTRVPKAKNDIAYIRGIVGRISNSEMSLNITMEDIKVLSRVSLMIYEQGDNGRALM